MIMFLWPLMMARESSYLIKGPRALLMGDTAATRIDDPLALFYNPATRSKVEGIKITPLGTTLQIFDPIEYLDEVFPFPETEYDIARRFMSVPVHLGLDIFPMLQLGPLTATYFFSTRNNLTMNNAIHPMVFVDLAIARGLILTYSDSFDYKLGTLHYGVNLKTYKQSGVNKNYYLFGMRLQEVIDALTLESPATILESDFFDRFLDFSSSTMVSMDVGVIQKISLSKDSEIALAFSLTDIMSRNIKDEGLGIFKTSVQGRLGASFKERFEYFAYELTADIAPIGTQMDDARRWHLGAGIDFGRTKLYAGLNEGYLSYGLEIALWPIRLVLGSYSVEKGVLFRQVPASRFVLYFELFDIELNV